MEKCFEFATHHHNFCSYRPGVGKSQERPRSLLGSTWTLGHTWHSKSFKQNHFENARPFSIPAQMGHCAACQASSTAAHFIDRIVTCRWWWGSRGHQHRLPGTRGKFRRHGPECQILGRCGSREAEHCSTIAPVQITKVRTQTFLTVCSSCMQQLTTPPDTAHRQWCNEIARRSSAPTASAVSVFLTEMPAREIIAFTEKPVNYHTDVIRIHINSTSVEMCSMHCT